jgi:hypothetical protein
LIRIIKKKWSNKTKIFLPNIQIHKKKYTYKYIINKKKFFMEKKINGLLNYSQQTQKRKVFTILKSPHVNKNAQEQIEYRIFAKDINILSFHILKFLILIKKIKMNLCPDVKIQIKFVSNNKIIKKTKLKSLNPDNYKTNIFFLYDNKHVEFSKKPNQTQILSFLKLFDLYGELNFKCLV